jgi:hypothetical protein
MVFFVNYKKDGEHLQDNMNIITVIVIASISIFGMSAIETNATPQLTTQEEISQFCDPNSPHMHFVNADEANICNVPKSTPTTPNDTTGGTTTPTAIAPSAK